MVSFVHCNKLSLVLYDFLWKSYKVFIVLQIVNNLLKSINFLKLHKADGIGINENVRLDCNKSYNVGKYNEVIFVGLNNIKIYE